MACCSRAPDRSTQLLWCAAAWHSSPAIPEPFGYITSPDGATCWLPLSRTESENSGPHRKDPLLLGPDPRAKGPRGLAHAGVEEAPPLLAVDIAQSLSVMHDVQQAAICGPADQASRVTKRGAAEVVCNCFAIFSRSNCPAIDQRAAASGREEVLPRTRPPKQTGPGLVVLGVQWTMHWAQRSRHKCL